MVVGGTSMMRTSLRALLLAVVVMLAVSCGSDDTSDEAAEADTPQTTLATEATEEQADTSIADESTATPEVEVEPSGTDTASESTVDPEATPSTTPPTSSTTTSTSTTTTEPAPPTTTLPVPAASTVEGLLALDRALVIAHAGGDQDYPHSTIYAYTQSALAGADLLELDVQLTADGVLIVQHDDTVDRTTETSGPVRSLTLEEIQALDNAYWFVPGSWGDQSLPDEDYVFRGVRTGEVEPPEGFTADDFRVATFAEVAQRFPDHVLDVEIKLQLDAEGEVDVAGGAVTAQVLADEIAALGRTDSVIVSSFDDTVIAAFVAAAPDVAASPAEQAMLDWFISGVELPDAQTVLQVPFTYDGIEVITPDFVERVHSEGRHVWVWLSGTDVVETRDFYAELISLGVDGLIAGRPAEAQAALEDA